MESNTTNTFTNQPRFVAVKGGKLWSTAHTILKEVLCHEGTDFRVLLAGPGWKDQKYIIERVIEWFNTRGPNQGIQLKYRMDNEEENVMIITKGN